MTYKIPNEYLFRLHHVRPRYKNDVEAVLLYVATSISEMGSSQKEKFKDELNQLLIKFKKNTVLKPKTIDNWRTEISTLFGLVQEKGDDSTPGKMAIRLADNQYLDAFFNYFLYSFQYPGGHIKPHKIIPQIKAGIKFKPCAFVLRLLIEGEKVTGKPFSITAGELTQCAYYDLRVSRGERSAEDVAKMIVQHRKDKTEYDYKYEQLKTKAGNFRSKGDICRYAGDILDYMYLANLLQHKGTGYYYFLNPEASEAIEFHLNNTNWFSNYDSYYGKTNIKHADVEKHEEEWFDYVNSFDRISEFTPKLGTKESESLVQLINEYHGRLKGGKKVPTKIIGDYGENLILVHEYLRTSKKSKRQHLINKIPTHFGVGYDIQSIEIENKKRYIEVKTTRSRKAIMNSRFKLTPNEWDTAMTIGKSFFIYYLVVNETSKNVFVINDPVEQHNKGHLNIDKNLVVEFSKEAGKWQKLKEIQK